MRENDTVKKELNTGCDFYLPLPQRQGRNTYVARLFADPGGDYLYGDTQEKGDATLDFESVYEKASSASYWINTGYADNVEEILALDSRYEKFNAFRAGNVYHYNARVNEFGGNDYWQSGLIHPDLILADLVKILHPDLLPEHKLYDYRHIGTYPNMELNNPGLLQ